MTEPTTFPNAAQIAKTLNAPATRTEIAIIQEVVRVMNLRVKVVELAAQFPASDPIKLAREIYAFITEEPLL